MKRIDIQKVIRQKYKGWIPPLVFPLLERVIHQSELNEMMNLQQQVDGVSMAQKVLEYLDVKLIGHGLEHLPVPSQRCIFVCNHPLGGLDGIALVSFLGQYYQKNIKVPVNDLLLNIEQFSDIFLPINKYGPQDRQRKMQLESALASDAQVITFPAGFCSRTNVGSLVRDRDWSASFLRWARRYDRKVVPLFFDATNSKRFYNLARLRERMGIKFNYELVLLPDEMMRKRGATFHFFISDSISPEDLPQDTADDRAFATKLRDALYDIPKLGQK